MSDDRRTGIRELKNRASRIVDDVREKGETYIVTRRGEPVAVLRPWDAADRRRERNERAQRGLEALSGLADRVAGAAGRRAASTAVSGQRR